MSAQEKIIAYNSLPAKIASTACQATMPIWALMPAIWCILALIALLFLLGSHSLTIEKFTGGAYSVIFASLLLVLGTVATGLLQESNIIVSQDGLFIPILTSASNHFDRFIEWRD
nr:hypothetical protein [bacterium]